MKIKVISSLRIGLFLFFTAVMTILSNEEATAQSNTRYMRIAKIVVDSSQSEQYKAALKEGIETAVRVEPGVLSLNAVYEKDNPTHVTVFEIYASEDAYKSHIQTAHFKKYKDTVKDMVKTLELVDVAPIALESKPK
jgi:4-carboxymuconolactone decarboxylase